MKFPSNISKYITTRYVYLVLILILFLGGFFRIYKITEVPPSLSWDEAAVGYNAWTIGQYGQDEWGKILPAYFTSFLDDKHPVHIYITAFFIKLMGLSELSVRLPSAIFGVLNILLLFYLGKILFKNSYIGILAAFLLAISPYAIHFSRFNHELNFAVFFFLLGLVLFYQGLTRKNILLSLSFFSFGISFISYHSAEVVVLPVLLYLNIFYHKKLMEVKGSYWIGVLILSLFVLLIFFNPELLGFARIQQTTFSRDQIIATSLFKKTNSELLGRFDIISNQYLSHFSPSYLFISGDKNPRLSDQIGGEFYMIDLIFLLVGFFGLLFKRTKESLLIIMIALLGPAPSALVQEAPHAARAMFMMGSWHLIAGYGIYFLINELRNNKVRLLFGLVVIFIYGYYFQNYISSYYLFYAKRHAIDWQYGMKESIQFVKSNTQYSQVYVTNIRSQPYIFFLFYLKTSLPEYLSKVQYNNSISRNYNLVYGFDKFIFDGWDPIESPPDIGKLYVLSPSQYDGLRYRLSFKVKKIVYFPDGGTAFFLVSAN